MKKILTFLLIGSSALLLFGCGKKASSGDSVTINYVAKFSDGTIFDSTIDEKPYQFIVDQDENVIKGLHEVVKEKKKNKTYTVSISPKDGFGDQYDNTKRETLSYLIFESLDIEPKLNTYYDLGKIKGWIKGIQGDGENKKVVLDTNPRQTRDTLIYTITIKDIK